MYPGKEKCTERYTQRDPWRCLKVIFFYNGGIHLNHEKSKVKYEQECPWCFFLLCYRLSTGKSYTQFKCCLCGTLFREYAGRMLSHPLYEYAERTGTRVDEDEEEVEGF